MTAIIVLNWNGWEDTIACLSSLYALKSDDFFVVVVDNGSSDDSMVRISSWLKEKQLKSVFVEEGSENVEHFEKRLCVVYQLRQNYGFAKGNNKGVALVRPQLPEHVLLLNNDTEVELDFLDKLIDFQKVKPEFKVLTPLIRYFEPRNVIWNAGGKVFLGLRKYFYANQLLTEVKESVYLPISFVTGCALLVSRELYADEDVLTERFFFGEEDFEFSLRMRKRKIKMACVLDAQIYHKVSGSNNKLNNKGKLYIHYLNRFIDVRLSYGAFFYFFWSRAYIIYVFYLLIRKGNGVSASFRFVSKLMKESPKLESVTKEMFDTYCMK